jgi:predicted nuclease of predicted toxin-antitoxin system
MNPLDLPLLADENIHSDVITYLKREHFDIVAVSESDSLKGKTDSEILAFAVSEGRTILTHDSDFGKLSIVENKTFIGILYLRPGHIQPEFTIQSLTAIREQYIEVEPPFIIVAERSLDNVKIRVRQFRDS